jgi:ATP-dependent Zn protease
VTTFQSADVSKTPAYSSPVLTPLVTASPTPAPSSSPTAPEKKKKKSNNNDDGEQAGIIAGSVIGGFVFLLLVFGLVYFFVSRQGTGDMETRFRQNQFSKANVEDSPRFDPSMTPGAHHEVNSVAKMGGGAPKAAALGEEDELNSFL